MKPGDPADRRAGPPLPLNPNDSAIYRKAGDPLVTKQLSFTNTNTEHTNVGTSSLLQASSPTDLASSRHFFKLDHSFLFHYLPRVKPASIAVYVALGVHANRERLCWPSLATLAVYSGYRKARS